LRAVPEGAHSESTVLRDPQMHATRRCVRRRGIAPATSVANGRYATAGSWGRAARRVERLGNPGGLVSGCSPVSQDGERCRRWCYGATGGFSQAPADLRGQESVLPFGILRRAQGRVAARAFSPAGRLRVRGTRRKCRAPGPRSSLRYAAGRSRAVASAPTGWEDSVRPTRLVEVDRGLYERRRYG
jgi:hypothetical protein